jgi:hypothetical protein
MNMRVSEAPRMVSIVRKTPKNKPFDYAKGSLYIDNRFNEEPCECLGNSQFVIPVIQAS